LVIAAPFRAGLIWRVGGEAPPSVSAVNATAWPAGTSEPYERPASGPLARPRAWSGRRRCLHPAQGPQV